MFKPFEQGDQSSAIYDLTLENQVDCVSLYGNLQITKDQAGLKAAKALQSFINEVVMVLEAQSSLNRLSVSLNKKLKIHFYKKTA
jgi:hypothetical protein